MGARWLMAGALAAACAIPVEVVAAGPAVVEIKRPAPARARTWLGLNLGIVSGSVDLPCPTPGGGDCDEGGVFPALGANLTVAGKGALRLRAIRAEEDNTDHKPYELAALVGMRMGRSHWYGLVGVGRIVHPDDDYRGNVTGLAWEFVRARPTSEGVGFEFSFYGNSLGDANFAGVAVGMRLGRLR